MLLTNNRHSNALHTTLTMSQAKRNRDSTATENMEKKPKVIVGAELELKAVNTIRLLSVDMIAKVNARLSILYHRRIKRIGFGIYIYPLSPPVMSQ